MDWVILTRFVINVFSLSLNCWVLLVIVLTPKLHHPCFDELFFSQNFTDMFATVVRISLTYIPELLFDTEDEYIRKFLMKKDSWANVINAAEWYNSWTIVISSFLLAFDRAAMAISMHSYHWFCNRFFKWVLVAITWIIPLAAILPMFSPCCGSYFYEGAIDSVEYRDVTVSAIFDSVDMIFETLVYAPVLCALNTFTLIMLYKQYNRIVRRHGKGKKRKLVLPTISNIEKLCEHETCDRVLKHGKYLPSAVLPSQVVGSVERLEIELTFAMISIFDQQIDFFVILFYTLYWASEMNFAPVKQGPVLTVYSAIFEFGNLVNPYVYLISCPPLRKAFFSSVFRLFCA
ncbi:unnamed protein product, partial [Mesorhabditis spiculigera]